jgi:hypothetical protein
MIQLLFLLAFPWLPTVLGWHKPTRNQTSFLPAMMSATLLAASCGFLTSPAHAGWFDWFGRDKKLEQANTALQSAAEVVNDSAKLQADQNIQVLEAVQALSRERMQLAGYLQKLSQFTAEDSQLAAAVTLLGPVLISAAVLAVGAYALRIALRDEPTSATALLEMIMNDERLETEHLRQEALEPVVDSRASRIGIAKKLPARIVKARQIQVTEDNQEMPF